MIRSGRKGRLSTAEMFPAGDPAYRVWFARLRSGVRIRVVERGDPAAPAVVLVPGWGCSAYAYRRNMPALAEAGFRVIAVDLKGHGLSDKPVDPDEYTVESLVDHLRDILDALGPERPALAGHSMGGSLLYHFAARYPGRATCLALLSPVGLSGVPPMWIYHLLTPRFASGLLKRFKSRVAVKIALARVYGKRGSFTERDVDEYWAPIQIPGSPLALRELLHSYDWHAAKHRPLHPVRIPAIGIWGSRDHLMPADGMALYQRLIPGIELLEIADAGHVVPEETPDEVNAALIAFFREHVKPGYIADA